MPAPLDGSNPAIVSAMAGGRGSVRASKPGEEGNNHLNLQSVLPRIYDGFS